MEGPQRLVQNGSGNFQITLDGGVPTANIEVHYTLGDTTASVTITRTDCGERQSADNFDSHLGDRYGVGDAESTGTHCGNGNAGNEDGADPDHAGWARRP